MQRKKSKLVQTVITKYYTSETNKAYKFKNGKNAPAKYDISWCTAYTMCRKAKKLIKTS